MLFGYSTMFGRLQEKSRLLDGCGVMLVYFACGRCSATTRERQAFFVETA